MHPTISLGRIGGVRIGLNWSWLIVFALIAWSLAAAVFPSQNPGLGRGTYVAMAVVAALLFFASLLLHELGHALAARREGLEIDGITLWLFGGVARFKGMFGSAGAEFRIAIAGPLVTLGLGAVFVCVAGLAPLSEPVDGVAAWLGYINLLLLAFNLLPALPLDGGRVLHAALWHRRGDFRWATAVAADAGRGFGWLMIFGGVFLFIVRGAFSGAWLAFVGWFLLGAAGAEAQYVAVRDALGGLHVADLMVRAPITVGAEETLSRFMDETAGAAHHTVYPVVGDGHVLGVLTFGSVVRTSRSEWGTRTVGECALALADVPVLRQDDDAVDAFAQLSESDLHRGLVLEDDRLVGLLSLTDIARVLGAPRPRRPAPPVG